jgi:hypothetical protein
MIIVVIRCCRCLLQPLLRSLCFRIQTERNRSDFMGSGSHFIAMRMPSASS